MNDFLERLQTLVRAGEVRISEHGFDEMNEDALTAREVIRGIAEAEVIEEYPNYHKGPCVLAIQKDQEGAPIHVVWGIPKGHISPAVLITAYRPNPERWDPTFTRRSER